MTNYDLHETSFSIPVDKIRGWAKYGTTALKPVPFALSYQIEPITLRYQVKQEFGHPTTLYYFIDCANSFIAVLTLVTTINCFNLSNSKSPTKESGLTWYRNFMRRRKYQLESQRSKRKHKTLLELTCGCIPNWWQTSAIPNYSNYPGSQSLHWLKHRYMQSEQQKRRWEDQWSQQIKCCSYIDMCIIPPQCFLPSTAQFLPDNSIPLSRKRNE